MCAWKAVFSVDFLLFANAAYGPYNLICTVRWMRPVAIILYTPRWIWLTKSNYITANLNVYDCRADAIFFCYVLGLSFFFALCFCNLSLSSYYSRPIHLSCSFSRPLSLSLCFIHFTSLLITSSLPRSPFLSFSLSFSLFLTLLFSLPSLFYHSFSASKSYFLAIGPLTSRMFSHVF